MPPTVSRAWFGPLTGVIAAVLLGILALHLVLVFRGTGLVRDQHMGTALLYARGTIDLLHPVIVGFNATGTPTPQEIPLWQALTAALMKFFGPWWGWGNVVSWLLFASCLTPFHRLASRHLGADAAGWATLALLLQPLIVVQAGQAGTDGLALAVTIWFVCLLDNWVTNGRWRSFVVAAVFAALAATQKPPFFMAAGITALGLVFRQPKFSWSRWAGLAAVGATGIAAFLIWNVHALREIIRAEFPLQELRMNTAAAQDWFFGTLGYRLDPTNWIRGGYRISTGVLGSFLLVPISVWALRDPRQQLARWWLAGAAVTTLVFTHLVLQHWHYFLIVSPAFALVLGGAMAKASDHATEKLRTPPWLVLASGCTLLLLASAQGLYAGHFLLRDDFARDEAKLIADHTAAGDKLVIAGGSWGGLELILSNRQGLSVDDTGLLTDPAKRARLRSLGYTKVVLLSQSPARAAVALLGGSQSARKTWESLVKRGTPECPVVFENGELSIRAIPAN